VWQWAVVAADGLLIKSLLETFDLGGPDLINGMFTAIGKMGWNYFVMYFNI
jgi:hypothetical protein